MNKKWMISAAMLAVVAVTGNTYAGENKDGNKGGRTADQSDQSVEVKTGKTVITAPDGYVLLPPPDITNREQIFQRQGYVNFPLTPAQIRALRKQQLEIEQAKDAPLIKPEIRSRAVVLSFESGAKIPEVEIAPGHVASLVFLDASGNPWPLADAPIIGDKDRFSVLVPKKMPNIVSVSTRTVTGMTNMSIVLENQPVPVNIILKSSKKYHDIRVDLTTAITGPKTEKQMASGLGSVMPSQPADQTMMLFVSGVPPKEAKEIKVEDETGSMRAWLYGERLFVRTIRPLTSPAWEAEAHGASGVKVYRLEPTPFILFFDKGGRVRTAKISLDG